MEDPGVTLANDGNDEPMWLNERKNNKEPKQATPTTGSDDSNRHTHSTDDANSQREKLLSNDDEPECTKSTTDEPNPN